MTPMHVLVLERDAERRDAVLGMLRAAGHRAAAAPDAPTAAAAIGVPGFDALLLDLSVPELDLAHLREAIAPTDPAPPDSLEAAERRHIALMLRHTRGNKRQAALLLGISRSTLLHKVRKYGLAGGALVLAMLGQAIQPERSTIGSAAPMQADAGLAPTPGQERDPPSKAPSSSELAGGPRSGHDANATEP